MRKSIITGLTLSAAVMVFAGQSPAHVNDPACVAGDTRGADPCIQNASDDASKAPVIQLASSKDSKPVHSRRKQPSRVVGTPESRSLRIPAQPIIRDCVHVMFPQCSRRDGLNDGTFGLPY